MRVLNTYTGQFVEINPRVNYWESNPIKYAILSHTWDSKGEQTYQTLRKIQQRYAPSNDDSSADESDHSSRPQYDARTHSPPSSSGEPPLSPIWDDPKLSPKIREACRIARENGYCYLWVDSCCIDKTSSSELSESINSMYQWYAHAEVCYAFLPDVLAREDHRKEGSRFRHSRWFKRGWTLQELIAPLDVQFLSKDWAFTGSKESLADLVVEITHINHNALLNLEPLDHFSVAQRFSWAAERETTREEDRAYSLLGIFDINMPTLYGEGERAFRRLQEEIMRRTPDQSLFAWTAWRLPDPSYSLYELLTTMPDGQNRAINLNIRVGPPKLEFLVPFLCFFKDCTDITAVSHAEVARRLQLHPDELSTTDYAFTPHGIRTQLPVISLSDFFPPECMLRSDNVDFPVSQWYLVILGCQHKMFPGCLLARICHVGTSESGGLIESLRSGCIGTAKVFDLLPVSPATIARLCSSGRHVSVKTLYIPQPKRDGMGDITRNRQHKTIKLVLQEKTCEALSVHGYTARLRSPDDVRPHTHSVTLSHDTHTITIDYQHTLGEHNGSHRKLTIMAQVKISETSLQYTPSDVRVPQPVEAGGGVVGSTVSWQDSMKWMLGWDEELGLKDVGLNIPNTPTALTLRLGLTLAKPDHYSLHIVLKTADPPSSPSGHDDVAPPELTNGGGPEETGRSWRRRARTFTCLVSFTGPVMATFLVTKCVFS